MSEVDVLVAGAGPAGIVCGSLLQRLGYRVLVWEARRFPRHRIGESLPPRSIDLLKHLGFPRAADPSSSAMMLGHTSIWGGAGPRRTVFPEGYGLQVERAWFDQTLAEESNLEVRYGCPCLGLIEENGRVVGATSGDVSIRAAFVVVASGCHARFRGDLPQRQVVLPQTAIFGYWSPSGRAGDDRANDTIIEGFDSGWVWSLRLKSGLRNVTVLTDPDDLKHGRSVESVYERALQRASYVAGLVYTAKLHAPVSTCDASWSRQAVPARPGILLVGDTSSVIDQLSSQGVYKALCSALSAAAAIHTCLKFPEREAMALAYYADEEKRSFEGHAAGAIAAYRQERRWSDRPFWSRRHALRDWDHLMAHPPISPEVAQLANQIEHGRASVTLRPVVSARVEARPFLTAGLVIDVGPCVVTEKTPNGYLGDARTELCRVFEMSRDGALVPSSASSADLRYMAYLVREGVLVPA